jgi:hypothetical protein
MNRSARLLSFTAGMNEKQQIRVKMVEFGVEREWKENG